MPFGVKRKAAAAIKDTATVNAAIANLQAVIGTFKLKLRQGKKLLAPYSTAEYGIF